MNFNALRKLLGLNATQSDAETLQIAAAKGLDNPIAEAKPTKTVVNSANEYGMTPLHAAAIAGHNSTARTLLELGADPRALNKHQQSHLFSALMLPISYQNGLKENKIDLFNRLCAQEGVDLKQQDDSGDTVMHLMATEGYVSLLSSTLQSHVELATIQNNHTRYPIHTAILNDQLESFQCLLQVPGSTELADSKGQTVLHYIACYGSLEALDLCCSKDGNIDRSDLLGQTPLMLAAAQGRIPMVEALIQRGASIQATDMFGDTVLHHAAANSQDEMVAWLLENTQVDPEALSSAQQNPY